MISNVSFTPTYQPLQAIKAVMFGQQQVQKPVAQTPQQVFKGQTDHPSYTVTWTA